MKMIPNEIKLWLKRLFRPRLQASKKKKKKKKNVIKFIYKKTLLFHLVEKIFFFKILVSKRMSDLRVSVLALNQI